MSTVHQGSKRCKSDRFSERPLNRLGFCCCSCRRRPWQTGWREDNTTSSTQVLIILPDQSSRSSSATDRGISRMRSSWRSAKTEQLWMRLMWGHLLVFFSPMLMPSSAIVAHVAGIECKDCVSVCHSPNVSVCVFLCQELVLKFVSLSLISAYPS